MFSPYVLGKEFYEKSLKIPESTFSLQGFSLLRHLGYSEEDISDADTFACGTMGLEGSPVLKESHIAVFETATPSGKNARRSIRWEAHIEMMASVQPFVSGAISKTINMPFDTGYQDVKGAYLLSWRTMNKSIALYRDGSKLSQPLTSLSGGNDPLADLIMSAERQKRAGSGKEGKYSFKIQASSAKQEEGYTQKAKIGGHAFLSGQVSMRTGVWRDFS